MNQLLQTSVRPETIHPESVNPTVVYPYTIVNVQSSTNRTEESSGESIEHVVIETRGEITNKEISYCELCRNLFNDDPFYWINYEKEFNTKYKSYFNRYGCATYSPYQTFQRILFIVFLVSCIAISVLTTYLITQSMYNYRIENSKQESFEMLKVSFTENHFSSIKFDLKIINNIYANVICKDINYITSIDTDHVNSIYNSFKNASYIEAYFDYTAEKNPSNNPCDFIWFNKEEEWENVSTFTTLSVLFGMGLAASIIIVFAIINEICVCLKRKTSK